MTLETSIKECCAGLTSVRATERKKSAETLKDFFTRNAVPSLLSSNTIKKKGFTWNDAFDAINEFVLKETEKYESSKSFDTVTGPLCASLLHLCVSGANKGKAYIKCEKIMDICVEYVLKDKRLTKAIGDVYLNLLYKHILPCEHYLGYMTPTMWEGLLDVCLTTCNSKHCKLDVFTQMRLLWLIIKNGRNCCQFVIPVRDSLTRLKKHFLAVVDDKKLLEVVIEIMILLLEMLSSESRLTMCEFTEGLVTSVLKFYDQNFDPKKKSSIFKLLYLTVVLHHPQGRLQNEEGALACDWDIWNRHLHNIVEVICLEVNFLQKLRKQNDNLKHCSDYFNLAAAVYFQVINLSTPFAEDESENSSKRQRITFNKNKCFNDLIEELKRNHVPWLAIILKYINNYGMFVSTVDYLSLTTVTESLVINHKNLDWDIFEEMACLIIKNLTLHSSGTGDEYDSVLISLWNSCVRTSTLVNDAHRALHTIMQSLLSLDIIKYQNVQPLLKLYFENGMPVTDQSMKTLNLVFHKFFTKCSYIQERMKCFTWLIQGRITTLEVPNVKELLLRLLASENIKLIQICNGRSEYDNLHDILFNSIDKCILFSAFEFEISKQLGSHEQALENCEINIELKKEIDEYLEAKLIEHTDGLENREISLLQCMKFTSIALAYVDILLKYKFVSRDQIENMNIFRLLKTSLKLMYLALTNNLNSNVQKPEQLKLLKEVKEILAADFDALLRSEVRQCIHEDFFHCVNRILITEISTDDEEILYEEDDSETNPNILRHSCICVLAAYCGEQENYWQEVLDLILDPKIYNFSTFWDVDCAFECIELLLNNSKTRDPPLESILPLMQSMCKDLFRNSRATCKILRILLKILDQVWPRDNMRQNCYIMVKGYLQRCQQLYYSPDVAALVYECAAKIAAIKLKENHEVDRIFMDALVEKVKGDNHNIRIYCCYLLKLVVVYLPDTDIESYLAGLLEIFVIKVSERNDLILKDESTNRTLTVLHSFFALAQTKKSLIHKIVTEMMLLQKEKSLDKHLVKKILNCITISITEKKIERYLNDDVLSILNFWFLRNNSPEQLPLYLFGHETLDEFLEKHQNWLISADILWRKGGIVKDGEVLKLVQTRSGKSVEDIIEACISNITVLCLPYIVTEKYRLTYTSPGKFEWMSNAKKLFNTILNHNKWSSLFEENISELILLIATHLSDHKDAKHQFQVNIPEQTKSFHYPKEVFSAIIRYIGELMEENTMKYLCEQQPSAIFKTLFKLWENFLQENVFEFKVLSLHTFITFSESIPLGYPSDAFVCNFACNSLAHAIKNSQSRDEIKVLIKALKTILQKFLVEKVNVIRKSVSRILSILIIKKEEFDDECASLLSYLVTDMKEYMNDSEDVIDFVSTMSQGVVESERCATKSEFLDKIKPYKKSLDCPSHETLLKMQRFLKINKQFINMICDEMNTKGFSDDCGTSIIHQIIYAISNTLKSASDNKTRIEACNCLAEIGNYDLKTLVTVPPADTQRVTDIRPKQYFAVVAIASLTEHLFDESPAITNQVAESLKCLLRFREGKDAFDLGDCDKQILIPFSSSNCNVYAQFKINDLKFNALCALNWTPTEGENHFQWVKRVTLALLEVLASAANYLNSLHAVCLSKSNVCKNILPSLMGMLLDCSSEQHIKIIGEKVNQFFRHIWNMNFDERVENSDDSNACRKAFNTLDLDHKMIVQYMLDIVNFVRLQRRHYKLRPDRTRETLNYLRLEYDKVAWAATVADQNLAALYYGELWAAAQNDGVPPHSPEATTQLEGGEDVQRILRKCYVSIGEMDAIDGCGTAHLTSEEEKRKHLINTGQFSDALLLHDIALSCGGQVDRNLQYGVVKSLHKSGMHHLALQYIKSLPENDVLSDIKYECLSFLGDWTDFVDTCDLEEKSKQANCNTNSILKAFRYSCLRDCLNVQTNPDFEIKLLPSLNRAKLAVARLCQTLNMENCQSVYKVLAKLHLFSDIEDYFSVRCNKMSIQELVGHWQVEKLPAFHDFKHLEALISQRSLILEHAAKAFCNSLNNIVSLQLQYAELGLSNQRVQMAQRLMALVKKLQTTEEVALVDSQISWAKGHKDIALSMLRNIVCEPSGDVKLTAISLRQYGLWMAETKCDNARDIINKYLKKSLEVLSKKDHAETRLKVYYDIAKFADAEYKQVVAYMNSSIFEKKVKCIETMKETACSLRNVSTQQSLNRDERKALNANDRFGQIDEAEVESTKAEKESFLDLAMRYYLLSLKQCEVNNLSVFRVISLWLNNPSLELADTDRGSFENLLHSIPSRKFVTVLPQLVPRLTSDKTVFAENLRKLIKRCAIDHPHHTLPILFSLKNSEKDKLILNMNENMGGATQSSRPQEPRVAAADALIGQLARENCVMAVIISQMEKMCDAIISFANYVPKTKASKQRIPSAELIHRLGHLDAIPIPSVTIPLSSDCNYSYLSTLYSFENYFELVGGINCPKKIICRSSDGKSRILLVKGEDDLRQDAVMQQVFNIVNTLLEKNPVTSRNKLLIRTYKVVPMSRRSGVLEWCEGTMPIGLYLIGNSTCATGAHVRYRPTDISPAAARAKLKKLHDESRTSREKFVQFAKLLKEFRPVFHYFFTEHYHDPVTWYERRLAYTKSVASSSMVGYILGLGDRHLQNILIDKNTAEVVHIDFGIAFDQGKTLPTPETIPFRLTQDIVAGFGSSGVEGIFRRCCEKTMQLLRDNQETLLTILEVLLCDPLYSWTVTSKQQNVLTAPARDTSVNNTSGSDGSLARRALLSVSSKLSGTEGGAAGGVAVPGQVARLIHTAMDPANLCRLFHGWQPYL